MWVNAPNAKIILKFLGQGRKYVRAHIRILEFDCLINTDIYYIYYNKISNTSNFKVSILEFHAVFQTK